MMKDVSEIVKKLKNFFAGIKTPDKNLQTTLIEEQPILPKEHKISDCSS